MREQPQPAGLRLTYPGGELVAEVTRSGFVESRHLGSVAVLDAAGRVVAAIGDITAPIFPRSANKPLQAVGMLRAGLRLAGTAELALATASHRGEPVHLERVRGMLRSGGFAEDELCCPVSAPLGDACGERSRVHHNCSGKHAAMLLTCRHNGWPSADYTDPAHPLQRGITASIEELAGEEVTMVGVDGCGAPTHPLSLTGVARAFARLVAAPPGSPERITADAMRAHPELVSGTGPAAADTMLMRSTPGMLAKGGAEGVQVVAVPEVGAVAIKIDDGAQRALLPVLEKALLRLGVGVPTQPEPVLGGGRQVGAVRAVL